MKGVHPWFVRWTRRACAIDFCPALAALVSPVKNIRQPGQAAVLGRLSLCLWLCDLSKTVLRWPQVKFKSPKDPPQKNLNNHSIQFVKKIMFAFSGVRPGFLWGVRVLGTNRPSPRQGANPYYKDTVPKIGNIYSQKWNIRGPRKNFFISLRPSNRHLPSQKIILELEQGTYKNQELILMIRQETMRSAK